MIFVDFLINEYFVIVVSIFMIFILLTQPQEKRKDDFFLILIYFVLITTALAVEAERPFLDVAQMQGIRYVFAITAYVERPLIVALLAVLIDKKLAGNFVFWIPAIINTAIYITAPVTHLPFYFEEGIWHPGSLEYMMTIVCILYAVIMLRRMYTVFIAVDIKEFILLMMAVVVSTLAGLFDKFYAWDGSIFLGTLAASVMVYYIYLHIQKTKEKDMKRVETINENELELQKKNAELMISQIQPHFLYNTLSSVKFLIKDNPKLAEETLEKFSRYLRANMSAIGKNEPISFEMEMEHVENYVFIEKTRFPYITVEYDIQDEFFDLPALTLQPLIENAIKHGIRGKQDGFVRIETHFEDDTHIVTISDNGTGFDQNTVDMHVGIENVKKRLAMMVDGTMAIDSTPGKGTVITLRIPEKEDNFCF